MRCFQCILFSSIAICIAVFSTAYAYNAEMTYFDNEGFVYESENFEDNFEQFDFDPYGCYEDPYYMRLGVGGAFGRFIAIDTSYVEFEAFTASRCMNHWLPFIDFHAYWPENNSYGTSVGIGLRNIECDYNAAWGANVYYDYRKGHPGNFNRMGVGIEYFGNCWEFHMNGYLPVGKKMFRRDTRYVWPGDFHLTLKKREFALAGVDSEIGFTMDLWPDFELYMGAGPYYFYKKNYDHFTGGQVFLSLDWKKYINLEALYSYDHLYKSRVEGKVMISMSLDELLEFNFDCCSPCKSTAYDPVSRSGLVFYDKRCFKTQNW